MGTFMDPVERELFFRSMGFKGDQNRDHIFRQSMGVKLESAGTCFCEKNISPSFIGLGDNVESIVDIWRPLLSSGIWWKGGQTSRHWRINPKWKERRSERS
jgi:hypothetical protein